MNFLAQGLLLGSTATLPSSVTTFLDFYILDGVFPGLERGLYRLGDDFSRAGGVFSLLGGNDSTTKI